MDTRLREADEIVILLLPKRTCYKQVKERLKRYNGKTREDVAEGCDENLDKTFKKWVLKDGKTKSKTARFLLIAKEYNNKTVILKSRKDINEYMQYKGIKVEH